MKKRDKRNSKEKTIILAVGELCALLFISLFLALVFKKSNMKRIEKSRLLYSSHQRGEKTLFSLLYKKKKKNRKQKERH